MSTINSFADKNNRTHYAEIKNDCSRDLQAAKVLETSQVVKMPNQANSPEGETYEQVCHSSPRALPQANSSFLWGNHRAKIFPSDKHDTRVSSKESDEDVDNEEYDDVGPSNFVAQAVRIIVCIHIPL